MTDAIQSERLVLRPLENADSAVVIVGLNDFEVAKWPVNMPYPFSHKGLRLQNKDGSSRWPDLAAISHDNSMIGRIFTQTNDDKVASGYFEANRASANVLGKLGVKWIARTPHFCVSRDQRVPHVSLELTQ